MPIPSWVNTLCAISLLVAAASAGAIALDEWLVRPQRMAVMNVVWPLTALWAGPLALYAYWRVGRAQPETRPLWQSVALGATHCGAGCVLADVLVEWGTHAAPVTVFGSVVYGTWAVELAVAFVIGIAFQYAAIVPMRNLGVLDGLREAVKADTLSLTAWQLGMYGGMAVALFALFSPATLVRTTPAFWGAMQLAMAAGFLTSYPVNWWLIRRGVKEAM